MSGFLSLTEGIATDPGLGESDTLLLESYMEVFQGLEPVVSFLWLFPAFHPSFSAQPLSWILSVLADSIVLCLSVLLN